MANRKHKGKDGLVPLARSSAMWQGAGWAVMKWSTILFTGGGFLASFAGMQGGGITLNGVLVEGWRGVWTVTLFCALAGALFGLIWLLIFKALALASKG